MKKVRVLLLLLSVLFMFSCKSAPKQKEEKSAEPEQTQEQEAVKEETDKTADSEDTSYTVYFASQSYQIDQFTAQRLKEIGEDLKAKNVKKIVVSGHSAKLDSQKEEDRIALQRAIAVASYFQKMKLFDANNIIVEGQGARKPARSHSEITDRFKNRRVEIHSVK